MVLIEQNIIKKEQIDKIILELNFDASNNKKYKLEVILTAFYTPTKKYIIY